MRTGMSTTKENGIGMTMRQGRQGQGRDWNLNGNRIKDVRIVTKTFISEVM